MTVEEAVRTRVAALTGVIALAGTRVYLDKLPQTPTYPCVRVQEISDLQEQHLRGPEGLRAARIQVDAFGHESSGVDPYAQAVDLAAAVTGDGLGDGASGVLGFRGSIGSPAVTISDCQLLDRRRSYDPDELRVVTVSQDFRVWYRAA